MKELFDECPLLTIQGHWLFESELEKIKELLSKRSFHALYSMPCENCGRRGVMGALGFRGNRIPVLPSYQ